jgi:hypothetical protein
MIIEPQRRRGHGGKEKRERSLLDPLNLNVEPLNLEVGICYSKQSGKYCISYASCLLILR